MRFGPLVVALAFSLGFLFGFVFSSLASFVHAHEQPDALTARRLDRIDLLEQRLNRLEALESAGAPTPTREVAALPDPTRARPTTAATTTDAAETATKPAPAKRSRRSRAAAAAALDSNGCPAGRKPFHVILTAQDSPYQAWQSRMMHFHLQRIRRTDPCTEITGFTRLLNSRGGGPDGLMDEMPTVLARALDGGSSCKRGTENTCDMGFPVMNRPHGATHSIA
jgi:hypothetical protein